MINDQWSMVDENKVVKSKKSLVIVIPAKAGIQQFQIIIKNTGSR